MTLPTPTRRDLCAIYKPFMGLMRHADMGLDWGHRGLD